MKYDAIVVSGADNVATALHSLARGQTVAFSGGSLELRDEIRFGHKFATCAIRKGDAIKKYGETIGGAVCDIAPGEHVHTHNVESLRGRGDHA